jgi:phage N-6-adenine-methyltransferase
MSAVTIIPPAAGLATRIRAEHEAAQSAMRSAVSHAVEAGKLLMEAKRTVGHGGWEAWVRDSCGFSERTAQGYMRLARLDPEKAQRVALLSLREALKALASRCEALPYTGNTEWYTPPEIVEAAREVMGGIDCDPASSDVAQETVRATEYFTAETDGLAQEWRGKVFCNPPYAAGKIDKFVAKMVAQHEAGNVDEGILLVHAKTDTSWFHQAASAAAAVCFTRGRIRFQGAEDVGNSPTDGSAFFYFGDDPDRFTEVFSRFGLVRETQDRQPKQPLVQDHSARGKELRWEELKRFRRAFENLHSFLVHEDSLLTPKGMAIVAAENGVTLAQNEIDNVIDFLTELRTHLVGAEPELEIAA